MPKELIYIRFVQIVIAVNTLIFAYGVTQARKGNIALHRKINGTVVLVTLAGVVGLVITVLMGWDYRSLTTPLRMAIHRGFSGPLLILLILIVWLGYVGNRKWHTRLVYITSIFWFGTLITGILFFL